MKDAEQRTTDGRTLGEACGQNDSGTYPPVDVNPLVRLWDSRADTLDRCADTVTTNKPLRDQLLAMASSYRQCAREFETPPVELFKELGFR